MRRRRSSSGRAVRAGSTTGCATRAIQPPAHGESSDSPREQAVVWRTAVLTTVDLRANFPTVVANQTHIYLMRHAHAVTEAEDLARPLSARGREQARTMADFLLKRTALTVERVWHSPLLRAVETADVFCDRLGISATRREIDGLLPFDDLRGISRRRSGFGYPLLIVGHEPHLGRLAAMLVCGSVDVELVNFKKGAILCLERESTKSQTILWRVRWYVTPSLLLDPEPDSEA